MNLSTFVFAAMLTTALNAQAVFLPAQPELPVYQCQNEELKTQVVKEATGETTIIVQNTSGEINPAVLLEQQVIELVNKTQTVYSNEELILKITNHPSGKMPGVLIVNTDDNNSERINLDCTIIYQIMNNQSAM